MSRFTIVALIGYGLVVLALVAGLAAARRSARESFSSPDAQHAWDDWRDSTRSDQQENLPVRRKTPKSVEPPMLVLLRDHFGVCLATSLTLTSVLYWTLVLFIRGAVAGPQFSVETNGSSKRE